MSGPRAATTEPAIDDESPGGSFLFDEAGPPAGVSRETLADPVPPPGPDEADPDAPYGRKADGSPRGKPGRKGGTAGPTMAAPRARGRASGKAASSAAVRQAAYARTVAELIDVPAGLVTMAAAASGSRALQADAIMIDAFKPALSEQVAAVAVTRPGFAAWLEGLSDVSPIMLLAMTAAGFVAQLLVNHGVLPAGVIGSVPVDAVLEHAARQAERPAT